MDGIEINREYWQREVETAKDIISRAGAGSSQGDDALLGLAILLIIADRLDSIASRMPR